MPEKKVYTVTGLPEYLSYAKQLNAGSLKSIKKISDKLIGDNLGTTMPFFINHIPNKKTSESYSLAEKYSFTNIQLIKAYIYTKKANSQDAFPDFQHNAFLTISTVDLIVNGKTVGSTYMVTCMNDLILNNVC